MAAEERISTPNPRRNSLIHREASVMCVQRRIFLTATVLVASFCGSLAAGAEPLVQSPRWSPFFEPGAVVMLAENQRSNINQGAFIGKIGLLKHGATGRAWGASVVWLYSDRDFYTVNAPPSEKRLWLLAQHRRPIGDGFFRYWGVSGGLQIWANFGNETEYEFLSTPVILETDIGLAGFLSAAMIVEFFSVRFEESYIASEDGVATLIEGAPTENSVVRLSMSLRFSFGS